MYNTIYIFLKFTCPIGKKVKTYFLMKTKAFFQGFQIKVFASQAKRKLSGLIIKNILKLVIPDTSPKLMFYSSVMLLWYVQLSLFFQTSLPSILNSKQGSRHSSLLIITCHLPRRMIAKNDSVSLLFKNAHGITNNIN